jgi:hypothetical protein
LDEDVEVVDGLALFRSLRDTDSEYLYNTTDTHWAPRGMRIMAKEIADRIERYKFGARARFAQPIVRTSTGTYVKVDAINTLGGLGGAWRLSPEQRTRAERAQTKTLSEVRMQDGRTPPDDSTSPVLVIGHSYVWYFREQLIKELNLLTCTRIAAGQTTEAFAEFLREPEILNHCRVMVWITTDQHMTHLHPMPAPIMSVLKPEK